MALLERVSTLVRANINDLECAHRCLRALENMALASMAVKDHMKDKDAITSTAVCLTL